MKPLKTLLAVFFIGLFALNFFYQKEKIAYSNGVGLGELIMEAINATQEEKEQIKSRVQKIESIIRSKQGEGEKELEMDRPIREMVVQFNFGDERKLINDEQFEVFSSNADMALRSVLDNEFNLSGWEGVKLFDQFLITVDLSDEQKKSYEDFIIKGDLNGFFSIDKTELEIFRNLILEKAIENDADSYVAILFGNIFTIDEMGDTTTNIQGRSIINDLPPVNDENKRVAKGFLTINPDLATNDVDFSTIEPEQFFSLVNTLLHEGALGHSIKTEHTCTPSVMFADINCTEYSSFSDFIEKTGEYFDNENMKNINVILEGLKERGYIRETISSSIIDFEKEVNIYVYPSLIQNNLNVDNKGNVEIIKQEIYNIEGKKIKDLPIGESSYDMSELQSGLYFLKLSLKDKGAYKKGMVKLFKK